MRSRLFSAGQFLGFRFPLVVFCAWLLPSLGPIANAWGQEDSVKPGINDSFRNPDVLSYVERFEAEGREVYDQRAAIVKASGVKPGMVVADIGAGTGLFTRLFSEQVGGEGRVFAVDIARSFVNRIVLQARQEGVRNIVGVICDDHSTTLPPNSIDLAYICDTYHHFEFPQRTLASLHQAMKKNSRLVVVDFEREEGTSSPWIMSHVRAGKATFREEIESAGFRLVEEPKLLKENYCLIFEKVESEENSATPQDAQVEETIDQD